MIKQIATSLICGLVAALLSLCVLSLSMFGALLANLATLPLFLAGFQIGLTGLGLAGLAGGLLIGGLFDPWWGLSFFCLSVLPALWLAHLTLLTKPTATPGEAVQYYPAGRIALWASILSLIVMAVMVVLLRNTLAGEGAFIDQFTDLLIAQWPGWEQTAADMKVITPDVPPRTHLRRAIIFAPGMSMLVWSFFLLLNLWLAHKIALLSGKTKRPAPDIHNFYTPWQASLVLIAAVVVYFFSPNEDLKLLALWTSMVLAGPFILQGLATVHVFSLTWPARPWLLGGVYILLLVNIWLAPLIAGLGIMEPHFRLRQRFRTRQAGPNQPT